MREWPAYSLALLSMLLLAACSGSEAATEDPGYAYEQTITACGETLDPQACHESANATRVAGQPTEVPPDPEVKQVFLQNDIIRQLVGDGVEREDYWLIIDSLGADPAHGDEGGMVIIVFDEPVSYSGPAPTRSDPCKGHAGLDERVDEDDPCLDEPREYGTTDIEFEDVRVVHTQVDTGRDQVVWLFPDDSSDDIVADMIAWIEETQY